VRSISIWSYFCYFIPAFTLLSIAIRGFTCEGAWEGIKSYLVGEPDAEVTSMTSISIWSDAFNQVYFTIGFCTGSMVSMGSFQKKESPIFKEVYGLLGANFLNSFFNGFAVFSMVGFLTSIDSVYQSGNRSTALVYITMPAANAELGWTRFFNFF